MIGRNFISVCDKTNHWHICKGTTLAICSLGLFFISLMIGQTHNFVSKIDSIGIVLYYFFPTIVACVFYISNVRIFVNKILHSLLFCAVLSLFLLGPMHTVFSPNWLYASNFDTLGALFAGELTTDEAYHSTLVNSIARQGFPTTGLSGSVFTPYHVLTHYFDAAIARFYGIGFLDFHGLAFITKTFAYILALLIFTFRMTSSKNPLILVVFFSCSVSLLYQHGNVVGSHPLWFPSLLLILFWPAVRYSIFSAKQKTKSDLVRFFFTGLFLIPGKLSLGIAFLLVGVVTFFRQDGYAVRILVGCFSLVFFGIFFSLLMMTPFGSRVHFGVTDLVAIKPFLFLFFLCIFMSLIVRTGICRRTILANGISLVFLLILTRFGLSEGSYAWFVDGFRFIFSLIFLSDLGRLLPKLSWSHRNFWRFNWPSDSRAGKFESQHHINFFMKLMSWWKSTNLILQKQNLIRGLIVISIVLTILDLYLPFPTTRFGQFAMVQSYPCLLDLRKKHGLNMSFSLNKNCLNERLHQKNLKLPETALNLLAFRSKLEHSVKAPNASHLPLLLSDDVLKNFFKQLPKSADYPQKKEWENSLMIAAFLGKTLLNAVPADKPSWGWGFQHYNVDTSHRYGIKKERVCEDFGDFVFIDEITPPSISVHYCNNRRESN